MNNKINGIRLAAILAFAFALTKLNFNNLSFQENIKSYIGFLIFIILILYDYFRMNDKGDI